MTMLNSSKISRQWMTAGCFVLVCAAIGAYWGQYALTSAITEARRIDGEKAAQPDADFVVPASPPEKQPTTGSGKEAVDEKTGKKPADDAKSGIDLAELRIWEIATKQALPPRKEPLTPPRWRVVGVTSVGDEKSVLLLFENQSATEIRRVGDKLPGGAKIVEIAQDHLRISLNGQLLKLNLRKQ